MALGMGIFPLGGSVGLPGVGLSTGDFEIWLKGALGVEWLSLWELCEGNLEDGLSTGVFKGWMKGALWIKRLSFQRLCGGGLGGGGGSFTGDPGKYVSLRIRATLCIGAPFHPGGTWYVGGARIPRSLIDE